MTLTYVGEPDVVALVYAVSVLLNGCLILYVRRLRRNR